MCKFNTRQGITCSLSDRDERCWNCATIQKNREQGEFWKTKDRLYVFDSIALGIPIESKTQWRRELKQRGLTDDFNQSYTDRKREILNYKPPTIKCREEIKSHIRNEMKEKGIYDKRKLFLDKPKTYKI